MKLEPIGNKEEMFKLSMSIVSVLSQRGLTTASTLSEVLNIPKKSLQRHCLKLKRAGILGVERGRKGGYFLQNTPKVGQIVVALDMPRLITGNPKIDNAFNAYLEMEV